jgi:hypothetical protein
MGASGDSINIGIGVSADPRAQAIIDTFRQKLAGLRQELAQAAATPGEVGAAQTTSINRAIGAYVELGRTIDVTNAKTVAAFRAEGDAISAYLVKVGATDAELNVLGATMQRVERQAGAAVIVPPTAQLTAIPNRARTAANSLALLTIAASGGRAGMEGIAVASGSLASGLALLASGPIALVAAGIGAVVTITVAVVEAFHKWDQEKKKLDADFREGLAHDPSLEFAIQQQNKIIDITRSATAEAIRLALTRVHGEAAARRQEIADEAHDAEQRVILAGGSTEAIEAIHRDRNEKLRTLDKELADQAKASQLKLTNDEIALIRKGTDDAFQARKLEAEAEFKLQVDAANKAFAIATAGEKDRDQLAARQTERDTAIATAARVRALTIEQVQRDQEQALKVIVTESERELLNITGQSSEARKKQINDEFDDRIKKAKAAGASEAQLGGINQDRTVQLGHVDVESLIGAGTKAVDDLNTKLGETKILAQDGAISEQQARDRINAAYRSTSLELQKIIPQLEAFAVLTHDQTAIDSIAALKTKLEELNATLNKSNDQFAELKKGATDALERGLAQGINDSITGAQNLRDIWAQAALSIIRNIQAIISQMIAQIAVQQTLNALGIGGGGGGGGGGGLSGIGSLLGGVVGFIGGLFGLAEGGHVRGPGTATSDSIPARLSNGEFVLRAAAVRHYGVDLLERMNAGLAPVRPRIRQDFSFADGRLVAAAQVSPAATGGARNGSSAIAIHLQPGLVAEVMRSHEGQAITIENMRRNTHMVRALFGGGGGGRSTTPGSGR